MECPVGGRIHGSGETPGGRRAEPWIQALRVHQEQREARQASGWKGTGAESRDGSRPGTGDPHGQASRGCSAGSKHLPSLVPPGCGHRRPPAPTHPLMGTGAATTPHVSTCYSHPAISGHWPSRSWEGRGAQGFLHRPCSSARPAAMSLGCGSRAPTTSPGAVFGHLLQGNRAGQTSTASHTWPCLEWPVCVPSNAREPAGGQVGLSPSVPQVLTGHSLGTGWGRREGCGRRQAERCGILTGTIRLTLTTRCWPWSGPPPAGCSAPRPPAQARSSAVAPTAGQPSRSSPPVGTWDRVTPGPRGRPCPGPDPHSPCICRETGRSRRS